VTFFSNLISLYLTDFSWANLFTGSKIRTGLLFPFTLRHWRSPTSYFGQPHGSTIRQAHRAEPCRSTSSPSWLFDYTHSPWAKSKGAEPKEGLSLHSTFLRFFVGH